ncbi:hypothetical protein N7462_007292 [Penicillium macrosclerotiorum]|uniref:uncharacterized protein n=1 Tax=Penicillium macrosclerotiorum TaxID=303699 RepID=UPI00254928B1|nr:uncharacterized protein N7462_007292 [Penicillium macrosclerotiorum]KAJ5679048.1 hypothetical protein N7462_007292 [Penicillium macrosclerotiorum]
MEYLRPMIFFALCAQLMSFAVASPSWWAYQYHFIQKRTNSCASILATSTHTCAMLAATCGITTAEFSSFNPRSSSCSSFGSGKPVCCSSGSIVLPPQASIEGLCYNYTVQYGDSCEHIAQGYEITVDQIEELNSRTWAWTGCNELKQGNFICLSSGEPPMPVALPNAVCGPQVPGTMRPSNWDSIGTLNPCPSNELGSKASSSFLSLHSHSSSAPSDTTTSKAATNSPTHMAFSTFPSSTTELLPTEHQSSTHSTISTHATTTAHATTTNSCSTTAAHSTTSAQSSQTSSSVSTAAVKPWMISIYSEKGCAGDYYLVQGYNEHTDTKACLTLRNGLNTTITDIDTSCRWWTNGGSSWASCDSSPLKSLSHGICTMVYVQFRITHYVLLMVMAKLIPLGIKKAAKTTMIRNSILPLGMRWNVPSKINEILSLMVH